MTISVKKDKAGKWSAWCRTDDKNEYREIRGYGSASGARSALERLIERTRHIRGGVVTTRDALKKCVVYRITPGYSRLDTMKQIRRYCLEMDISLTPSI